MERNEDQGPTGGITPHLTIRDGRAAEAIDFYKAAFGATEAMPPHMADDSDPSTACTPSGETAGAPIRNREAPAEPQLA